MKYIYIYINVFTCTFCVSQNLVPNCSFETYTICPISDNHVEYAPPWTAAITTSSSTDYYNACSSVFNVPNTPTAFQNANTGSAFVGLFFAGASSFDPDSREYLQVQLTSPLVQNITYFVEFYVNLHDASFASPCNNIMANFSVARPFTNNLGDLQMLTPHIVNSGNPIISDRINWVQVSGCYTAQGGEEYLTIGNFFSNANTQFTGTTTSSYYFVDDVRVEEMTTVCVTGVNELSADHYLRVYPNPNNGSFSIAYTFEQTIHTFELFDLVGKKVSEKVLNGNDGVESINLNNINHGIYFYKVVDATGKMLFSGKLVISK